MPVSMAQKVARPKNAVVNSNIINAVFTAATRSKNPQKRAVRHTKLPTTTKGMSIIANPERVLVTNRQVRSTGRVCISPTARELYR